MATITKTIGTASRDYSTITLWEADHSNSSVYSSGDDAIGECYNDSVFSETVYIDGVGSYPTTLTLTAANGEKHDGTTGTGVTIRSSHAYGIAVSTSGAIQKAITFIECDGNAKGGDGYSVIYAYGNIKIQNCIVHNLLGTGNSGGRYGIVTYSVENNYDLTNNII